MRRHLDVAVSDIASHIAHGDEGKTAFLLKSEQKLTSSKLVCYETLVKYFSSKCFKISEVIADYINQLSIKY